MRLLIAALAALALFSTSALVYVVRRGVPFVPPTVTSPSAWTDGDHTLATTFSSSLKEITDRLNDCSSNGHFRNPDSVPDSCNTAYIRGTDVLDKNSTGSLLQFLRHGCAKWRKASFTVEHTMDCEGLGLAYWHLQEAIEHSALAGDSQSVQTSTILRDSANKYVAAVNPGEVSQELKTLSYLNTNLEKSSVNPGLAFTAGQLEAGLDSWIMTHCPTELAWGGLARLTLAHSKIVPHWRSSLVDLNATLCG